MINSPSHSPAGLGFFFFYTLNRAAHLHDVRFLKFLFFRLFLVLLSFTCIHCKMCTFQIKSWKEFCWNWCIKTLIIPHNLTMNILIYVIENMKTMVITDQPLWFLVPQMVMKYSCVRTRRTEQRLLASCKLKTICSHEDWFHSNLHWLFYKYYPATVNHKRRWIQW